jgi:hypothetical protein
MLDHAGLRGRQAPDSFWLAALWAECRRYQLANYEENTEISNAGIDGTAERSGGLKIARMSRISARRGADRRRYFHAGAATMRATITWERFRHAPR